ncbi:HGGxSTG domain-containing protein [Bradyrhizobium sp. USDA 4486]
MRTSPRCGAQTRDGDPCRAPALRGRPRCRMHGGAAGSGAPFANSNAIKHGFFTGEAIEERKLVSHRSEGSRATAPPTAHGDQSHPQLLRHETRPVVHLRDAPSAWSG